MDKSTITTRVENILQKNTVVMDKYITRTLSAYMILDEDLVKAHKNIFGKQSYCIVLSSRRLWVWEFQEDDLRVYVNNGYGFVLETTYTNIDNVCKSINMYFGKLGIPE